MPTLFDWKPPAQLAIFPSTRRRVLIMRVAAAAASCRNPDKTIQATLKRTRASFVRRRLPTPLIERDLAEFEQALRSQLAALVARQGGAAR